MDKTPKLKLEPTDTSKVKLSVGEENNTSAKFTTKFKLDSEPIGLAESAYKLSLDLEKAYDNPSIKAYMQAEEDRKTLIQASIDKWNEPSLQNTIIEYDKLLKSPTFAMALEKSNNIQDYVSQIANSFDNKNYEEAKKALEGFTPKMNSAYTVAQSAVEQMQKTIASPSIQSYLSQLPNLEIYESGLAKAAASIGKNEDLLGSAKILAGLGTSLASDSLNYKISEQSRITPEILKNSYTPIKIPENPLPEQNVQIISILEILKEQNDTIITVNSGLLQLQTSDSDIQNNIILLMQNQQTNSQMILDELKVQNEGIKEQLTELKKQNNQIKGQIEQKEREINDNKTANNFTRKIAICGIGISIVIGFLSILVPYHVSTREKMDNDNDKDNKQLLQTIKDKRIETQKQDQVIKLIEEQNRYLKKISDTKSR